MLLALLVVGGAAVGYRVVRRLYPDVPPPAFQPRRLLPPSPRKAVYPYSVVGGGVHDASEVRQAVHDDAIVARHYAGLRLDRLRVERKDSPVRAYLSYRVDNQIYWTKARHTIPAGETLITDGENLVRARCGNRVSEVARQPAREPEPTEEALDTPLADAAGPIVTPGLPDAEYFAWIGPKSPPPYVDFELGGLPPFAVDHLLLPPNESRGSAAVFPGYGPPGMAVGGGVSPASPIDEPLIPANPPPTSPVSPPASPGSEPGPEPGTEPAPPGPPPTPPSPPGPGPWPPSPPGPGPPTPPGPGPVAPPGPGPVTPPGPGPVTPPGPMGDQPPALGPATPPGPGSVPPLGLSDDMSPPVQPLGYSSQPTPPASVPEPTTLVLVLAGLVIVALRGRKR